MPTFSDDQAKSSTRAVAKGRELLSRVAAHLEAAGKQMSKSGPTVGRTELQQLHEVTMRVFRLRDVKAASQEILRAAVAAAGTNQGLLSLASAERGELTLNASEGFPAAFEELVRHVPAGRGACGVCYARRAPLVVEDANQDPSFAGFREAVRAGGFSACHSVPIFASGTEVVGVLTVHFADRHAPAEGERQILERYAEVAGGVVERMRAEQTLRASEQRFRAFADHSSLIVWATEPDGSCSYLNARWRDFTGLSEAEGLGTAWLARIHPEDRDAVWAGFSSTAPRLESRQAEYRLRRKDGAYRWMLDTVAPRFGENGEFLGYLGSVMDITERRTAEREARENAQRLSLAMGVAKLGDWSWEAAVDAVTCSESVALLIGISPGSTLSSAAARAYVHEQDREAIVQSVAQAIEAQADFEVECRVRRPNAAWSWVAMRGRAIYGAGGGLQGLRGVVQDITRHKHAEQALREQEAQLRLVSTNAPVILSHWSRDHRLRFANRAFADRWHKNADELLGRTVSEVLGPEAWAAVEPYVQRVLRGESVNFEMAVPYAGVGPRYMRVSYAPEIGERGEVRGYFSAVSDLTDRRRAELALRESEERLRLATQTGKVGLWDWDIVTNRITWTESLYAIHGVTPASFNATIEGFIELIHPDDAQTMARTIDECLRTADRYEVEFRAVRPDGEVIWLFSNAVVLRDAGKPIRMLGGTLDVTARKRAELAMRESEEKFRALARHAPVGIFMTNLRGDCLFVNENWCTMAGLPAEEAVGQGWMRALHPDDRARVIAEWDAAMKEHRPFALEYRFLRADGRVTWLAGGAVEFRDSQNQVGGRIGTVADITERKAAEFALRESEKRFRTVASRAPVGIFMTSPQGDTVFVNDSWCAMAGLKPDQALGDGWLQAVHPDDRARVISGWTDAVNGGAPSTAEYRFLRPDGTIAWVQGNAVQLRDAMGRHGGYVGTIADFTQRKAAEMALRESEERYRRNAEQLRLAMSVANLGDWVWDPLTDGIAFSLRGAEIFGVAGRSDMTRSELRELLHPDDRERARLANENAIAARSDYDIEYRLRRPAGEWCWVAAKGRGVYAADGRLINMLGVVQDITARKLAEEKLRAQEAQLRLISTNAPTMLVHCDAEGRYLFVNRAYADRLHARPEEVIGRTITDVLGAGAFAAIEPYVKRVLAGESVQFEVELPFPGVGTRFIRSSYVPDFAEDGHVRGWLSASSDLTDRRQIEEALRLSETRYRRLVEMLPVAVYTCDQHGRVDLFNEAAVALWGRTPQRGVDQWTGAYRVYHPDGTPFVLETGAVAAAVREGRSTAGVEVIFEQPNGERKHVLANPHPIFDASGKVVGAVNAVIDITEHKQAEWNARFLNQLSQELGALSDPDAVMRHATRVVGSYYRVQRCYFIEQTGDPARVKVDDDWRQGGVPSVAGIHPVDPSGRTAWWHAVQAGVFAVDDVETHPLTGDLVPTYVPLEIRAYASAPVSREGRWVAALAITDRQARHWREDERALLGNIVTLVWPMIERARAEVRLQAYAQELEQKVEQRTGSLREAIAQMEEFSYSVSHDLRSPLRAMNAYAEALLEDYAAQLDERARGYLERIQRSSVRMENLTHDVLTYSRIAREEMQLTPVRLDQVLRDLIDQYAELQPGAADVTVDVPHTVLAHESSLGQCLGNLLTNAAKFVRPGERPRIHVSSEAVGERVQVSVKDAGIGIPPQYHGSLFQVFERVPTRARYEGTGIGLAIVRKAAEKMGGRCGVESDGEHGSRFWVELTKA